MVGDIQWLGRVQIPVSTTKLHIQNVTGEGGHTHLWVITSGNTNFKDKIQTKKNLHYIKAIEMQRTNLFCYSLCYIFNTDLFPSSSR